MEEVAETISRFLGFGPTNGLPFHKEVPMVDIAKAFETNMELANGYYSNLNSHISSHSRDEDDV